jgi:hypothetical protein
LMVCGVHVDCEWAGHYKNNWGYFFYPPFYKRAWSF